VAPNQDSSQLLKAKMKGSDAQKGLKFAPVLHLRWVARNRSVTEYERAPVIKSGGGFDIAAGCV
jgi:hypothetical protein